MTGLKRASAALVLLVLLSASLVPITAEVSAANVPSVIVGDRMTGNESVGLAGDVSNVTWMNVTLDGMLVGSVNSTPFVVWIDSTQFSDGMHNLTVEVAQRGGAPQVVELTIEIDNRNLGLTMAALPLGALAGIALLFTLAVGLSRRKKGGEG